MSIFVLLLPYMPCLAGPVIGRYVSGRYKRWGLPRDTALMLALSSSMLLWVACIAVYVFLGGLR